MLFELYVDTYIIYVRYIHTYTNIIWGSLKSEAFTSGSTVGSTISACCCQGPGQWFGILDSDVFGNRFYWK